MLASRSPSSRSLIDHRMSQSGHSSPDQTRNFTRPDIGSRKTHRMSQHIEPASRTQVMFTRDFREFIRGGFQPGALVAIRYDPYRIVPPGDDYTFGDPARPVVAHLRFNEGGPVTDLVLVSHSGMHQDVTDWKARRVPMLTGNITIPEGADWMDIWFSFASGGREVFDSNWGKNYRLRFYRDEL